MKNYIIETKKVFRKIDNTMIVFKNTKTLSDVQLQDLENNNMLVCKKIFKICKELKTAK